MAYTFQTAAEISGIQEGFNLTTNMHHTDISQGQLGNCWVIAAVSAVAEHNAVTGDNQDIEQLFLDPIYTPGQPVPVQLYDNSGNGVVLYVPDSFPVDEQGMPCYATPKTSEDAWVMFLEAAFAMLYSGSTTELSFDSYQLLVGGPPARALLNITGPHVYDELCFEPSTGAWVVVSGTVYDDRRGQGEVEAEHVWHMIADAARDGEVLCCGTGGVEMVGQDNAATNGVAETHAYSITDVVEHEVGRLIYMRNPWGQNDQLLEQLQSMGAFVGEDGIIGMYWEQFLERFDYISIVNYIRGCSCLECTPAPCHDVGAGQDVQQEQQEQDGNCVDGCDNGCDGLDQQFNECVQVY
ncbi:hypothetical protein COO60DRAFT_227690 [Scenedesmus sp. NREL 46B-D3]|nr:hypothetical protein COO60DRAFT_227690 [Scenedesmus sp. NREL 46B-D3]